MSDKEDDLHDLKKFPHPARVLIINHETFDLKKMKENGYEFKDTDISREGTNIDILALQGTFEDLLIKDVTVVDNLDYEKIKETINEYSNLDYTGYGCIIIIVMTHGQKGGWLCANDRLYHENVLWTPIIKSVKLKHVPKIFITQACRSNEISPHEIRVKVKKTVEETLPDNNTPETLPPEQQSTRCEDFHSHITTNPDEVIYIYSTLEDRSSIRVKEHGSWFMLTLAFELRYLNEKSLQSILAVVNERMVNEKRNTSPGNNQRTTSEIGVQASSIINKPQNDETRIKKCAYGQISQHVSYLSKDIIYKYEPPKHTNPNMPSTSHITPQEKATTSNLQLGNTASCDTIEDDSSASLNVTNNSPGSRLESDAVKGMIAKPDKESTYAKCTYQGRMYILYDKNHSALARELSQVAQALKLLEIPYEIASKQDGYDELKKAGSKIDGFKEESLLLVAILTDFNDENHFTEELMKFKKPFLATECESLIGKPKIFMFIDLQEVTTHARIDSDSKGQYEYVTENSDFLIIRGFGRKYITILFEKLKSAVDDKRGLLRVVLDAKRKFKEELAQDEAIKQPHIDFTLRKRIMLHNDVDILPLSKVAKIEYITLNLKDTKHFVGRGTQLEDLKKYLKEPNTEHNIQVVIHGNYGNGKTYLMLQCISYMTEQFKNILIFDCFTKETLQKSFEDFNTKINRDNKNLDPIDTIEKMYHYIDKSIPAKSLFIFDNVNDQFDISSQLQQTCTHFYNVIITRSNIYEGKYSLEVLTFIETEAIDYIKILLNNISDEEAKMIAEICGCNPLKITLICMYAKDLLNGTFPQSLPEILEDLLNEDDTVEEGQENENDADEEGQESENDDFKKIYEELNTTYKINISGIKSEIKNICENWHSNKK